VENLASISKSIQSKRNQALDSQSFPLSELVLSDYDIRKNRARNPKLREDLLRDGQLQPITVSRNTTNNVVVVVNGRTRQIEMTDINSIDNQLFTTVKVEVYDDLTELEQNYLNAQINISQNPLTPDEKIDFVIKYKDVLDPKDLAKALGLDMKMLENYLAVASTDKAVREAFTPKSDGYGRSEIKIEELGKVVLKAKQVGVVFTKEELICMGKKSEESDLKRDEKRIAMPKMAGKLAEFKQIPALVAKYSAAELVDFAEKESMAGASSGDKLPQNSSEKYKTVDALLKGKSYEFAILLCAEALYRTDDKGVTFESETKRIIDSVDEIIVVGNEIQKLSDIEDYANSLGKTVTIHNEDIIDTCAILDADDRCGLIYVNGASLYTQRPEFMNYLKKKYSNSTVAMVVIDLLFGKSQVYQNDRMKEILTVYSGAETFNDIILKFRSLVKFTKVRQYATTPQEKYIIYV